MPSVLPPVRAKVIHNMTDNSGNPFEAITLPIKAKGSVKIVS